MKTGDYRHDPNITLFLSVNNVIANDPIFADTAFGCICSFNLYNSGSRPVDQTSLQIFMSGGPSHNLWSPAVIQRTTGNAHHMTLDMHGEATTGTLPTSQTRSLITREHVYMAHLAHRTEDANKLLIYAGVWLRKIDRPLHELCRKSWGKDDSNGGFPR